MTNAPDIRIPALPPDHRSLMIRFWRVTPAQCLTCGDGFDPRTTHNGAGYSSGDRRYCSARCRNKATRVRTKARQQERDAA